MNKDMTTIPESMMDQLEDIMQESIELAAYQAALDIAAVGKIYRLYYAIVESPSTIIRYLIDNDNIDYALAYFNE